MNRFLQKLSNDWTVSFKFLTECGAKYRKRYGALKAVLINWMLNKNYIIHHKCETVKSRADSDDA